MTTIDIWNPIGLVKAGLFIYYIAFVRGRGRGSAQDLVVFFPSGVLSSSFVVVVVCICVRVLCVINVVFYFHFHFLCVLYKHLRESK